MSGSGELDFGHGHGSTGTGNNRPHDTILGSYARLPHASSSCCANASASRRMNLPAARDASRGWNWCEMKGTEGHMQPSNRRAGGAAVRFERSGQWSRWMSARGWLARGWCAIRRPVRSSIERIETTNGHELTRMGFRNHARAAMGCGPLHSCPFVVSKWAVVSLDESHPGVQPRIHQRSRAIRESGAARYFGSSAGRSSFVRIL